MRVIKIFLYFLSLVLCLLALDIKAFAFFEEGLIINEIYAKAGDGESEWIEIFNNSSEVVDLKGYSIEDATNKPAPLKGEIKPYGYIVLEGGVDFEFKLNNDGDKIVLKYELEDIDTIYYGDFYDGINKKENNASAPKDKKSLSRIPNGQNSESDKDDFRIANPSKNSTNIIQEYSKSIIINEILADPTNGTEGEFIELYNESSVDVDLKGWFLDDKEGGSGAYEIDGVIVAGGYMVFYHEKSHISLNNNGDEVRLINPCGDIADHHSYTAPGMGFSWSRFKDGFSLTSNISPNAENIKDVSRQNIDVAESVSIMEGRELFDKSEVTVTGYVIALPGQISASYFYIQDEYFGIQIYNYKKEFPNLQIGQKVRVRGILSTVSGERRIKSEVIEVLDERQNVVPRDISISDISETYEGVLVKIQGEVVRSSGDTFTIKDGDFETKIIVKNNGVDKPRLKKGDRVVVIGVISQYKDNYRVLSYLPDSVIITARQKLPRAGSHIYIYFIITGLWITSLKIYHNFKKKRNILPQKLKWVIYTLYMEIWVPAKLHL